MIRIFVTLLLSFSLALMGFSVQAAQLECSVKMMKMDCSQKIDTQDIEDCGGCDKMVKQDSEKSGCCDDAICNTKCSAMSSSVSVNLLSMKAKIPAINQLVQWFYVVDANLASVHLNSQERPPKYLS